jgi:hypothetical protein
VSRKSSHGLEICRGATRGPQKGRTTESLPFFLSVGSARRDLSSALWFSANHTCSY